MIFLLKKHMKKGLLNWNKQDCVKTSSKLLHRSKQTRKK